MKPLVSIFFLLLPGLSALAQDSTADAVQVYVVDSVEVGSASINNVSPDQIAMITIARGKKTVEKYGEKAANGVFYIETKPFARKRYNRLFSSLSPAYADALRKFGSDSSFQYIVGDSLITTNQESQLAALEKENITDLQVLTANTSKVSKKQSQVKDSGVVKVVIKTK